VTFEKFARDQVAMLLGMATAICGDPLQAEDLVQDVFLKVLRNWERIEQTDHPLAYVRRMLVNEQLSWRRKWSRIIPHEHVEPPNTDLDHCRSRGRRPRWISPGEVLLMAAGRAELHPASGVPRRVPRTGGCHETGRQHDAH
jgi:hypothetical protein